MLVEVPATATGGPDGVDGEAADRPLYAKWWFWAAVGGVVLGGLGIAAAAGAFTSAKDAPCPGGNCK